MSVLCSSLRLETSCRYSFGVLYIALVKSSDNVQVIKRIRLDLTDLS